MSAYRVTGGVSTGTFRAMRPAACERGSFVVVTTRSCHVEQQHFRVLAAFQRDGVRAGDRHAVTGAQRFRVDARGAARQLAATTGARRPAGA